MYKCYIFFVVRTESVTLFSLSRWIPTFRRNILQLRTRCDMPEMVFVSFISDIQLRKFWNNSLFFINIKMRILPFHLYLYFYINILPIFDDNLKRKLKIFIVSYIFLSTFVLCFPGG
jgi:hypothetical protein